MQAGEGQKDKEQTREAREQGMMGTQGHNWRDMNLQK